MNVREQLIIRLRGMRKIIGFVATMLMLTLTGFKGTGTFESVAVIELFTSEGCSSCPPADELLGKTILQANRDGKKIYAIALHVDYWNRLGWKDSFSTNQFSERQQSYVQNLNLHGAYTPQMVVNGRTEFVGSDEGALDQALNKALATNATAAFTSLKITEPAGKGIGVHYELQGDFSDSEIHLALVSLHEVTAVKRGENGGRTLKHSNVVRQLLTGRVQAFGEMQFAGYPVPSRDNLSVIAFVQRKTDGQIIAASETH